MLEVKDMTFGEIEGLLDRVRYGHLGCAQNNHPYVVPIHFAYDDRTIYIYTTEGKKSQMIDANPEVCLQFEEVVDDENWSSVVVVGDAQRVTDAGERERAFAAVTAAMSVWSGPLHGGPRQEVLDCLYRAAASDVGMFVRRAVDQGHMFPGFDARLTAVGDIRAAWLTPFCRQLADQTGNERLEQVAEEAEKRIGEETGAGPSLDWPLTRLLHYLGFDADLFKPVATIARIAGWSAHAIEQAEHNQLLRPRGRYVGPKPRTFRPLEERG